MAVVLEVGRVARELVDEQAATPEAAAEMASGLGRYLAAHVADAAELGAALYLATVTP